MVFKYRSGGVHGTGAVLEFLEGTAVGQRWSARGAKAHRGKKRARARSQRAGRVAQGPLRASELRAFSGGEGSLVVKRNAWETVLALFLCLLFLASLLFLVYLFCFVLAGRCEGAGDWGAPVWLSVVGDRIIVRFLDMTHTVHVNTAPAVMFCHSPLFISLLSLYTSHASLYVSHASLLHVHNSCPA